MGRAHLLEGLHELFYPERCYGCGVPGDWVCEYCLASIPLYDRARQAAPLPSGLSVTVSKLYAMAPYGNPLWSDLIRAVKYEHAIVLEGAIQHLLKRYRELMAQEWLFGEGEGWILVPIPTQTSHVVERGGDHMEVWIRALRSVMPRAQVDTRALSRTREGNSHASFITKAIREVEAQEIFYAQKYDGKSCILVDDVYTTGATMQSAAKALVQAGASRIELFAGAHS